jgi:DNA-binding transcriptional LysR family regulator
LIRYTLKQLAYFAAAAERGHVTEAARALNVSQPSISTAIAHLERVLGAQLFVRHHARGLSLTPDGRHFLVEARQLLAQAEELGASLRSEGARLKGELSLGYFVTFAPYYLPGLLRRFRSRHPDVLLQLREGDIETLQRGLATGGIELALVYDLALGPELVCEHLAAHKPYALLPAAHPLAKRRRVSLRTLAKEPFVLLDLPYSREYFRSVFLAYGLEPQVRYTTPSLEMVRGLVANGHGVGLLNIQPEGDRAYDGMPLACRALAEDCPPLRVALARPAQTRPSRAAQALIACARDHFVELRGVSAAVSRKRGAAGARR